MDEVSPNQERELMPHYGHAKSSLKSGIGSTKTSIISSALAVIKIELETKYLCLNSYNKEAQNNDDLTYYQKYRT